MNPDWPKGEFFIDGNVGVGILCTCCAGVCDFNFGGTPHKCDTCGMPCMCRRHEVKGFCHRERPDLAEMKNAAADVTTAEGSIALIG